MSRWDDFIGRYGEALNLSQEKMKFGRALAECMARKDDENLNEIELSFKVGEDVKKCFRIMELDADGYACRGREMFQERLKFYRSIMTQFPGYGKIDEVTDSFRKIPLEGLDLAFGVDLEEKPVFGLWLMSLGDFKDRIKKDGTFPAERLQEVLKSMGMSPNKDLKRKLLQRELSIMGVDFGNEETVYKFYWKRPDKSINFERVSEIINRQNLFRRAQLSQRYDCNGEMVDEKIYFEIEGRPTCSSKKMEELLGTLKSAAFTNFSSSEALKKLYQLPGNLSWVGVDVEGTVTFYVRGNDA